MFTNVYLTVMCIPGRLGDRLDGIGGITAVVLKQRLPPRDHGNWRSISEPSEV
jgi:hypothetical protein